MFQNKDKRKLYWLIDQYLTNKLDAWTFSNEFQDCYDLELDLSTLNPIERKAFSELSTIVGRFSPFEKDFIDCPNAFFTEDQLKEKVLETKKVLLQIKLDF